MGSKITKRIPGLDGLRGLAAIFVLLGHMGNWGYHIIPGFDFSGIGRSGVYLFFVLSAFLLTAQILEWGRDGVLNRSRWESYFMARILRIWPLYIVVLIVSLVSTNLSVLPYVWRWSELFHGIPVAMSLDMFWQHVLLQAGEDILWTIPVEFKFYFVLPLIMLGLVLLLSNRPIVSISIVFVAVFLSHLFIATPKGTMDTTAYLGIFLTGVLLAFIQKYLPNTHNYSHNDAGLWEMLAWGCCVIYIITIPSLYAMITGVAKNPAPFAFAYFLYSSLWGLLIIGMLRGKGIMRSLLETRILIFLGKISYSLYLWHRASMYLVHRIDFIPEDLKPFAIFVVALLLATASFYIIEYPILRWRKARYSKSKLVT